MTEEIEAHVLKKYEILQKLGKSTFPGPYRLFCLHSSLCKESSLAQYSLAKVLCDIGCLPGHFVKFYQELAKGYAKFEPGWRRNYLLETTDLCRDCLS